MYGAVMGSCVCIFVAGRGLNEVVIRCLKM